jgi:hypothetical protein
MSAVLPLDLISPSLAVSFRRANDHQRRKAVLAACLVGVAQAGLQGDAVDAAIDLLRHGENDERAVRPRLDSLSAQLDDRYFKLSQRAGAITPEALLLFRKARAAAALAFALSQDPGQLEAAIYEAIYASVDQTEAIRMADLGLSAG